VLNSQSLAFAEALYAEFLRDPAAVEPEWRQYFEQIAERGGRGFRTRPAFQPRSIFHSAAGAPPTGAPPGNGEARVLGGAAPTTDAALLQHRVDRLVRNYRIRGHIVAAVDPLGFVRRPRPVELDPAYHGFTAADMDRRFETDLTPEDNDTLSLREIIERLEHIYCRSIGVEFMHIDDLTVRRWITERVEWDSYTTPLTRKEQLRILTRLTDAVIFEQFLRLRFQGKKSFSLEGGETLIPLLDMAIERAAEQGLKGIIIGMAHRGRLNVLANIMGKSPHLIFREFDDKDPELHRGRGDVKYHLGYSTDWEAAAGKIHLSLCFNPSHLEFVNPVACGRMRANQDRVGDTHRTQGMTILIHGDAAFAGEGIVQETLNLSQLPAYSVGGTLHVIVNNQLGFTTPPESGRSTEYASDVAKMLQIPIFHVNGEDPEAVARVVRLALDFRMQFQRDVVIDMYCYRRRGHNETDEPAYTQPLMYRAIEQRQTVREGYVAHLLTLGGVTVAEADRIAEERKEALERELSLARTAADQKRGLQVLKRAWSGLRGGSEAEVADVETGVAREKLMQLLEKQTHVPDTFHVHPKLLPELEKRRQMALGRTKLHFAAAEALAFASLAVEGVRIRMTGQDCERGTFSHRHAVLHDVQTGETYMPLQHLSPTQAPVDIYDSALSEAGVLGFEYGYSLDYPEALVLWEAQFGDFVNAAQVIIDQFIASAEAKWNRLSGLVLLLPHGFEGQGPEHSSARLERFLQLACDDNIQVAYPTTPAQYFHLLRRQVVRGWRKPLIVMTPKGLLRHEISTLDECAAGRFRRVIGDPLLEAGTAAELKRIVLCSGKIYYELEKRRQELARRDVAIIRLEQLYPLPMAELRTLLAHCTPGTPAVWVQEEPENQGAWWFLRINWGERLLGNFPLSVIARAEAASPATGSYAAHLAEQEEIIADAIGAAHPPAGASQTPVRPRPPMPQVQPQTSTAK
jgi:2-oxoglutarate dehydrogenase E1 component